MSVPATIPLTYNLYVAQVANLAVVNTQTTSGVLEGVDAAFNTLIPQMLDYAELRIQRDLDLLPSLTSRTYPLPSGSNILSIDANDFVTVQTISIAGGSVYTTLLPVSKEFLENVWADPTSLGMPQYFAMIGGDLADGGTTYNNIMIGPYPDQTYTATFYGTVRLPSLYANATTGLASTGTTFISTYYPDLLVQASMIIVSQFQRNFGAGMGTTNDPQMPGAYEAQYQTLLKGALVEENRKKFSASAWSSMAPPVVASPMR